jgi:tetratricopeptide (TPR) repeat protein
LSGKTPAQAAAARKTLAQVDKALAESRKAMAAGNNAAAHTALEDVRIDLMKLRRAQGVDYFMDRLTAFHEPMEVLALAGNTLKPQDLTPVKRAEMEKTYAEARALWRSIEQNLPDPKAYRLNEAQQAQFNKGMADVTQALSRLSEALRGTDDVALLKAAATIKPPFARTFTAFGRYN